MVVKIWFTGDSHFSHDNIIGFCNRPFKNVNHMNEEIIKRWNKVVKPDDIVFHLGDFGWRLKANKYKERLNGNIVWIKGNHDKSSHSHIKNLTINFAGKDWFLTHNPADAIAKYNIVGHVHDDWKVARIIDNKGKVGYAVNVGVDQWNFTPISIKNIIKAIENFKKGEKNVS